jgi:hypothetical protein
MHTSTHAYTCIFVQRNRPKPPQEEEHAFWNCYQWHTHRKVLRQFVSSGKKCWEFWGGKAFRHQRCHLASTAVISERLTSWRFILPTSNTRLAVESGVGGGKSGEEGVGRGRVAWPNGKNCLPVLNNIRPSHGLDKIRIPLKTKFPS